MRNPFEGGIELPPDTGEPFIVEHQPERFLSKTEHEEFQGYIGEIQKQINELEKAGKNSWRSREKVVYLQGLITMAKEAGIEGVLM